MNAPLVVVTGTGTGIGKTYVATKLTRLEGQRGRATAGIKPIESGTDPEGSDAVELGQASTFHVTRFTSPYLLRHPVSPHLAARMEGRSVELDVVLGHVASIRAEASSVILELPGGLFSPLTDTECNLDLVRRLDPTSIVLVALDRLGVLHDVIATKRAAEAGGVPLRHLVINTPPESDPSTGTNAAELARLCPDLRVHGPLARGSDNVPRLRRVLHELLPDREARPPAG